MNLPNILTLSRMMLAFVFMYFLFSHGTLAKFLAISVFFLATLTDYYDGYFARKKNITTSFGKLMDPIADKILVLSAFLSFVEMKLMPAWMAMVIVFRELVITGVRLLAITNGTVIPAMRAGKHKTVSQYFAIILTLGILFIREIMVEKSMGIKFWTTGFHSLLFSVFLFTTFLTLISGISFLYYHRFYLIENKKKEQD
ncbi:MAG: CDP-diacylglycerol--glycerol-3-phosphate 3-phosphatidyltransferase [Candidatus Omnitrophica bacterium]|nr:CDP-diacylglycerol--glycerol-3-phosphate 3-phosphatidyltransferase [Candidatus Omnitrophota bacterium]